MMLRLVAKRLGIAKKPDRRGRILISGTGRAGTTFLVQLLTELGLDTGYSDPERVAMTYSEQARAGLEWDAGTATHRRS